jgi:Spy/CpxP family protein refolding chaperone
MKRWTVSVVAALVLVFATIALSEARPGVVPPPPKAPDIEAPPSPDDGDALAWDDDGDDLALPPGDDGDGPERALPGARWGMGFRRRLEDHIRMRAGIAQQLDLTSEQRDRMAEIRERAEKRRIQASADLRIAAVDLRHLLRSDRPDRRAIDAQIDRLAAMRAGMMKARIGTMLEMRSVLSPEQQRKMREFRGMGPMRER